jgi:hypothetical protein
MPVILPPSMLDRYIASERASYACYFPVHFSILHRNHYIAGNVRGFNAKRSISPGAHRTRFFDTIAHRRISRPYGSFCIRPKPEKQNLVFVRRVNALWHYIPLRPFPA